MHQPSFRIAGVAPGPDTEDGMHTSLVLLECGDCGGLVAEGSREKHINWHRTQRVDMGPPSGRNW